MKLLLKGFFIKWEPTGKEIHQEKFIFCVVAVFEK